MHEHPIYQDLSRFSVDKDFRGRSPFSVLLWQLIQSTLFGLSPQPLYGWRRWLLRIFGANVGRGVLVRPTARITYPWKVKLGDYCWIGDHAEIYSLGAITIGPHAVVSQRCYICTGSHNPNEITFPLIAQPIVIEAEAWIAANCFIAPGVTVGSGTIVAACSVVLGNLPSGVVAAGAPATIRKHRNPAHEALIRSTDL